LDAQKREGYGRMPNSLIKSGAWAKFHPKMKAVYGALLGLLDRTMTYTDSEGTWRVAYGHPTQEGIAKASAVRVADTPRITERLEELGIIIKTPCTINKKRRNRYIIPPPEHPTYSRIGYTCERIFSQVGKGWGLTRQWGSSPKPHELPVRLQPHESPTRLHFPDIHRPKSCPTPSKTLRRPIPSRAAARPSHRNTAKGKSDRLLVALFTGAPPETWDEHTTCLLADRHRLCDIEEAKQRVRAVLPYLPALDGGKGGPAGETVGVPPERKDSSSRLLEKERRLCHGITQTHSECVLSPMPGSRFCRCHQAQAERA